MRAQASAQQSTGDNGSCSILIPVAALALLAAQQRAGPNGKCSILTCGSEGALSLPAFFAYCRLAQLEAGKQCG